MDNAEQISLLKEENERIRQNSVSHGLYMQLLKNNEQLQEEIRNIKRTTVSAKLVIEILDENARLEKKNKIALTTIGIMAGITIFLVLMLLK